MVSIKFLYDIDSLHMICYTLLVEVTWLSGLLGLDTKLQERFFGLTITFLVPRKKGLLK